MFYIIYKMNTKKPPDKEKLITIKCNISKIIKNKEYIPLLFDISFRTNKIVIQTYHFLRFWILQHYHNNIEIPIITTDIIKMIFNTLTISSKGGNTPKGNNLKMLNQFQNFYNLYFLDSNYEKVNSCYLSQILNSISIDILTNIENNIKLHFFKYVKKFVNSSFRKIHNNILENTQKGKKIETRKLLNKELFQVKEDLLNNTLLSDLKYHEWINQNRNNIFPLDFINSYEFDIQNNPQKYIKSMIYMCLEIEKIGCASYQFFPLRTDIIPKYIPIDTKSLIEIFIRENKNELLNNIEDNKINIWNTFFNLDNSIFKQSNYIFDYKIYTDCYSVSIQMLHKDKVECEKKKKQNMKNKRKENRENTKNMTQEEKEVYKMKLKEEKKKSEEKYKLEQKEKKDKEKEEFKKLSKDEQQKIKNKIKTEKEEKDHIDFKYLEDLNNEELKEINNNNWVVIDPGKKTLLYMKDKNGKELKFTNKRYVKEIKRLKYQNLLQNYKNKSNISNIENELSNYNSKSCNLEIFKEYIKNKNRINNILFDDYNKEIFRKYKWYGYINRKKVETNLIREIKSTFGKNSILLFGDWSMKGKCHKGNLSTPNVRFKKLIGNNMKTYNLDEYNTSKLNYKTETLCENLYLHDKKGVPRKIHSVLTYKMENKQSGCINRDKNAVCNMVKIVNYYLLYKKRLENYCRTTKDKNLSEQDTIKVQGQVLSYLP